MMGVAYISVHNLFEARALLKEWDATGYCWGMDIQFSGHDGREIGLSKWIESEQKHEELP